MFTALIIKLKTASLWHFVWISLILSEILSSLLSIIFRGGVDYDYLATGGITSIIVSSAVIYAIRRLRETEESFTEKKVYLDNILRSSIDMAIVATDLDLRIKYYNETAEKILGYKPAEVIGRTAMEMHQRENVDILRFKKGIETVQKEGEYRFTFEQIHEGKIHFIESRVSGMLDDEGNLAGYVLMMRDISSRKQAEKALYRSERFLNTIFDSIYDPFSIMDRDFKIIRVNEAYAQIKNKSVKDLVGKKCYEVLLGRDSVCRDCVVEKTFHSADPCAKDKLVVLPDGSETWIEIYTYPIFGEAGTVTHVIEYTRDITDRKRSDEDRKILIESLKHLSRTDSLTNLLNRRALMDRLAQEIERAKRYVSPLSLILCDIDYLKEINDTYGHMMGDRVLMVVSSVIREAMRKSDISGRYGGDEFMMILPETSINGAIELAERIRSLAEESGQQIKSEKPIKISLSLGVTTLKPLEDIDALIKRVDTALYTSKDLGRNMVSEILP